MSFLCENKLGHSTVKCYLSAVRHLHLESKSTDHSLSSMARPELVLRGVKYLQSKGANPHTCLLISLALSRVVERVWANEVCNEDQKMLWAAVTLCFFGFLRAWENTVPADRGYDPGAHLSFTRCTRRLSGKAHDSESENQGIENGLLHYRIGPESVCLSILSPKMTAVRTIGASSLTVICIVAIGPIL